MISVAWAGPLAVPRFPLVAGSTMRKVLGKGAKAADELPMDEASRMARAEEMGFDKDVLPRYECAGRNY